MTKHTNRIDNDEYYSLPLITKQALVCCPNNAEYSTTCDDW